MLYWIDFVTLQDYKRINNQCFRHKMHSFDKGRNNMSPASVNSLLKGNRHFFSLQHTIRRTHLTLYYSNWAIHICFFGKIIIMNMYLLCMNGNPIYTIFSRAGYETFSRRIKHLLFVELKQDMRRKEIKDNVYISNDLFSYVTKKTSYKWLVTN